MSFSDVVDVKDNCKNPYVASLSNVGYIVVLRCFARYHADWKHVILGPLKHGRASPVFRHADQQGHSSAPLTSIPFSRVSSLYSVKYPEPRIQPSCVIYPLLERSLD